MLRAGTYVTVVEDLILILLRTFLHLRSAVLNYSSHDIFRKYLITLRIVYLVIRGTKEEFDKIEDGPSTERVQVSPPFVP